MTIRILFVEDNEHKRSKIVEYIRSTVADVQIEEAWSFTGGCRKLEDQCYDLVLLDMTLPTYDRSISEAGGRIRIFGGREIARKIFRTHRQTKVLFITQFNSFSDRGTSYNFDDLQKHLGSDLQEVFMGLIYYNSAVSTWRDELLRIINERFQ